MIRCNFLYVLIYLYFFYVCLPFVWYLKCNFSVLVRESEAFELLKIVSKCFKFQRVAVKFMYLRLVV